MAKKNIDRAVALRYDKHTDHAPKVVAKGSGSVAEKIKETARTNNIPLYRDDVLVDLLSEVELDREIPPELYNAIAEILSWIYKANNDISKEMF
jgi:flagellar biosynthesis protein